MLGAFAAHKHIFSTNALVKLNESMSQTQEHLDKAVDQLDLLPSPYKELGKFLRPVANQALALVVLTFLACWGYAVNEYGWFLGIAFGWIPSAIIAAMLGALCWWAFVYIPWNTPSLLFVTLVVAILVEIVVCAIIFGGLFYFAMWASQSFHAS